MPSIIIIIGVEHPQNPPPQPLAPAPTAPFSAKNHAVQTFFKKFSKKLKKTCIPIGIILFYVVDVIGPGIQRMAAAADNLVREYKKQEAEKVPGKRRMAAVADYF